ncbi:hypothetical protein JL720_15902 [Aureococcus anophagefferens]|nr:hypothetical protein JL720_15902 [Aureococcus anophagefferens]
MVPMKAAQYGRQIRRFTRAPAAQFADDFAHHAPNVARLNHGSFGAAPKPVLEAEQAIRMNWLRQPDAEYFSRALDEDLAAAAAAAGAAIGAPAGTAALVENATVAAIALHRWRGAALLLSCAYGGVKRAARALLGPEHVVEAPVAVDGAHAVGQVDVDVEAIGADFYYSNIHKWAFAGPTATVLHARDGRAAQVVPSWNAGEGLLADCRWTGTRDYAAMRAAPVALDYLRTWRSADGLDARTFNARGLRRAAAGLARAWRVGPACDEADCFASMGMVRLPRAWTWPSTRPACPPRRSPVALGTGGVEAAVGGFREDDGSLGGFLRLSHAVYNTDDDFRRLRDAILDLRG